MSKFQDLIKDAYKLSKGGFLVGIIYTTSTNTGFKDIKEDQIDNFVDTRHIDMLYLKSTLGDVEMQIYENEFKDYKIKQSESTLYILTTKGETPLMY